MFRKSYILVVALMVASCLCAEQRTWTDSTGKHKKKGEFVKLDGQTVVLKSPKGKRVKIPLKKLSKADQKLIKQLVAKKSKSDDDTAAPKKKRSRDFSTPRKTRGGQAVNMVRAAPHRAKSMSNLKQIAFAMIQYESQNQRYPTVGMKLSTGKPGLSWRVAILPFLEQGNLYRQFRRNEPWDSPHNKKLISKMPKIFQSPGGTDEEGMTNYLAVASPDSIIVNGKRGTRNLSVRDGTSKTLLVVEADDTEAVPWTKPDDFEWTYENPSKGLGKIWLGGQFLGVMADGSVHRLNVADGNDALISMFTKSGSD